MAQNDKDADLIKAHLQPYIESLVCPICKGRAWKVGGPVAELFYEPSAPLFGNVSGLAQLFPVAFMICDTCAFVHHFAWAPMLAAAKKTNG